MHQFKCLKVWENAVDFCVLCYSNTSAFPPDERFGLMSQIRRASVSVAANIAEGAGRNTNGEFKQFLGVATGSLFEVETQLIIASRLNFLAENELKEMQQKIVEIQSKIYRLKQSLA